jgi:hypothetical protein
MRITHRSVLAALLILALTIGIASVARAGVTENVKVPLLMGVFIPCANSGAGEVVTLSGSLHILVRYSESASGAIHVGSHFQPQGVSGVGETTGDRYRATGVTQNQFNANVGVEETFVNNFRIIGPGPGNNYLVHNVFHITFNANGTITAFVDKFSVDCR